MASNETAITTEQSASGNITCSGGFSRSIAQLNNTLYGLEGSEAAMLNPHKMMLLHCTRECIKNAGFTVDPKKCHFANWGVFAGLSSSCGGAANCIARTFNFTGPTMVINTESTSLSALNVACLHLKLRQCNAAVVCGARAILSPSDLPDLPSSAEASFAQGEGCAAVLLMSLGMAKRFNRRVLAVIKATSSNGNYPPSQKSQAGLLRHIFHEAGLTSKDVSYVEADLKGTKEEGACHLAAIQEAFTEDGEEVNTVTGSLKVNIGDLGAASGIGGLIRAVMVLEHAWVPGSACSDAPKPTTCDKRVVSFPEEITDLSGRGKPLAGAVSSFGLTGSNEVAVIQQYSILPHMAGVSSWLVFGADHMIGDRFWLVSEAARKSSCYAEVFGSLKTQFPLVRNALVHFNQTFQMTCEKYRFKPHQKIAASFNVAVLKLYYGIITQLFASGIKVSVLGGTNATNEIVALLFAGSIDLSTAILFMCCKCETSKRSGERSTQSQKSAERYEEISQPGQEPVQSDKEDPIQEPTQEPAQTGQEPTQPDQDVPTQEPIQSDQEPTQEPVQPDQEPTQEPIQPSQDVPTQEPIQPSQDVPTQEPTQPDQEPTQEPIQPSQDVPTQERTQEPGKDQDDSEEPQKKPPTFDAKSDNSMKGSRQSSKESVSSQVRGLSVHPSVLVKLMTKPKIPVFSCIKNKMLSADTFTQKALLTEYATELVANIGKLSDLRIYMHFLVGKGDKKPLLHITSEEETVDTKDGIFTISFKHLHDANSPKYLRDMYLNLREFSDKITVKKDAALQSKDIDTKEFYERYPFRRVVEGLDKPQDQVLSESSPLP